MKKFKNLKDFRDDYGLTLEDVAKELDVSKQSVWAFENTRKLPKKHKKTLEEKYNCLFVSEKEIEKEKYEKDIIEIEHICLNTECGTGIDVFEEPYIEPFRISRQSINAYLKCSSPDNLKIFKATGDSMEDKISDGDWLLVDVGRKDISVSGIYVFVSNNKCRCKRLNITLDGKLHIKSDNKKYEEEVYSQKDNIEIKVIGRVLNNLTKGI